MTSLPLDNPYALLGLFLAPSLAGETHELLASAARQKRIAWEDLLYQANLHFCTPLWYVRMKQGGLLPLLPPELHEYLHQLHAANCERNQAFREALREQLLALRRLDVPVILLKGAATFCDDLYGDPGARMMGDIDLLVASSHLDAAWEALSLLGYREVPPPDSEWRGYTTDYRPHHLSRLHKPGTPVAVEVHFQVGRGQDGRTLPVEMAWKHQQRALFEGMGTTVLDPTRRLLHNAVHALVTQQHFIRSNVSLRDLAEFAALAQRYTSILDWNVWFEKGAGNGLKTEFMTYLALACRLTGMPRPQQVPDLRPVDRHLDRILAGAKYLTAFQGSAMTPALRLKRWTTGIWTKSFFHRRLPAWLWCNSCHGEGLSVLPVRLRCMVGRYRWLWRKKCRR